MRRAAARRVEETKILRLLGRETDIEAVTDPGESLAGLAGIAEASRRLLQDRLAELAEVSSRDKLDVERSAVLIDLFDRSLARSAGILIAMSKINLTDRQVRVDESKAALMVELVTASMMSINLPPSVQAALWTALKAQIAHRQSADPLEITPPSRRDRRQIEEL